MLKISLHSCLYCFSACPSVTGRSFAEGFESVVAHNVTSDMPLNKLVRHRGCNQRHNASSITHASASFFRGGSPRVVVVLVSSLWRMMFLIIHLLKQQNPDLIC